MRSWSIGFPGSPGTKNRKRRLGDSRPQVSDDGRELIIRVRGRFDFSAHEMFGDTYELLTQQPERYRIDMQEASYLDSSALGMLLLLRDHAGGDGARVEIVNCNHDVRRILHICNFQQLFRIH